MVRQALLSKILCDMINFYLKYLFFRPKVSLQFTEFTEPQEAYCSMQTVRTGTKLS